MHGGLSRFLKHAGSFIKLVNPFKLKNYTKQFSFIEALKPSKNKKFW